MSLVTHRLANFLQMKNHFFIFGRPRSRTAWLANFLTYGETFCSHEGMADCSGSLIELERRMAELPARIVGNADTGLIHIAQDVISHFPKAKLIVLTENEFSWRMFCTKNNINQELIKRVDDDYRRTKELLKDRALFVPINLLTAPAPSGLVDVWLHLGLQLKDFPLERFNVLRDLNVQIMPESLQRRVGIPTGSW